MDEEKLYKLYQWKPEMGDYLVSKEERGEKSKFRIKIPDKTKTLIKIIAVTIIGAVIILALR